MAINKNNFKNAEGNYEAKNTLMDAVIDGVNRNEANISLLLPASAGVINMGPLEAGVVKSEQVSFPSSFASGKSITVVATPNTINPSSFSLSVPDVSVTGFTLNALSKSNRSTCWVYWVAIQRPSS